MICNMTYRCTVDSMAIELSDRQNGFGWHRSDFLYIQNMQGYYISSHYFLHISSVCLSHLPTTEVFWSKRDPAECVQMW